MTKFKCLQVSFCSLTNVYIIAYSLLKRNNTQSFKWGESVNLPRKSALTTLVFTWGIQMLTTCTNKRYATTSTTNQTLFIS